MDYSEIIGRRVFYYDYLGMQHKGYIVYAEPSQDPATPFLYLANIDPGENVHKLQFTNGAVINYAELRPSDQVILFEEGDQDEFGVEDIV